ncbi:MAG: OstA-like protein, partial [Chitinophagaceae bacterium]
MAQVIPPPVETSNTPGDSLIDVTILGTRHLTILKVNDSTTLQILAGDVKLKQATTLFTCDSCVINGNTKTFEAWGNVHINDADTANIYSSHLRYLINKKIAYLDGGVKLTDGKGTLTTPDLEYDMTTDLGIYKHGGKVINKKTVLTSQEGYYYAGLRDVYFKKNVELKDPAYYIKTDSLLYNTQSQTTRFIAMTFIKDSSGRTIETKEGYYNLATGKAEFGQRPIIRDGKTTIIANRIAFDDSAGTSQAVGNVIIIDSVQGTT